MIPAPRQSENAKHLAAAARAVELVAQLRIDIHHQIRTLSGLADQLADLADTHQPVGVRIQTPTALANQAKGDALDRLAARTLHVVPGKHPAPVTVPAVSALAEVQFGLQEHVGRLGRALIGRHDPATGRFIPGPLTIADLEQHVTWHAAQAAYRVELEAWRRQRRQLRDRGLCSWPTTPAPVPPAPAVGRNPLVAEPPTTDCDVPTLFRHLGRLIDHYTNRTGLEWILRDLNHLKDVALTVVDGIPAQEAAPNPTCPWCGRDSLVLIHRQAVDVGDGVKETVAVKLIRCAGAHRCRCDRPTCACHRPKSYRHEWNRLAGAADTWTQLASLQTKHQELIAMDTKALIALERIRQLHQPTWTDEHGHTRTHYVLIEADELDDLAPGHECITDGHDACQIVEDDPEASLHSVPACAACQASTEDGIGYYVWPCATYRLTDLDAETDVDDSPNHQ